MVSVRSGLEVTQSLKMVPFESLPKVYYSRSIVTMALSCIISKIKHDMLLPGYANIYNYTDLLDFCLVADSRWIIDHRPLLSV